MEPLKIIVDTREQTPWQFPVELATTVRGTLNAGDYALDGDMRFAIERKSLNDFLGTISAGWDRFNRELARMEKSMHVARVVIVEGGLRDIFDGAHNHSRMNPKFVLKRIAELSLMSVTVLMADTAAHAAALAYSLFKRRWEQLYGISDSDRATSEAIASLGLPETGQQVDYPESTPRHINSKRYRQRRAGGRAASRRTT